jgi:hypothetical protein
MEVAEKSMVVRTLRYISFVLLADISDFFKVFMFISGKTMKPWISNEIFV